MKKYLLIVMSFVFLLSCFDNSRQLKDKNRIFRTAGKYYVYYNGNTMEMPANLYITGDKKLEDYYAKGWLKNLNIEVMNKSELLNDLDKYFPDGIDYITTNENVTGTITIPLMTVDGKQYIDSIKFEKFLATLPAKGSGKAIAEGDTTINANALLKGKKIEILNAGGIDGLAKKVGDELVQKFGVV